MAKKTISQDGKTKICADGANRQIRTKLELNNLRESCAIVKNFLLASRETICGWTHGSDELIWPGEALDKLHGLVITRYLKEFGSLPSSPFTQREICRAWIDVRKANWKRLKDAQAIPQKSYPLFDETERSQEPSAVVYAYWGRNQKVHKWLIKIGYTCSDLGDYLRNLQLAYDPQLLATTPGGRLDEREEHARYARQRCLDAGREWFYPSIQMFDDFRRTWFLAPDFDRLTEEVLKTI